MLLLAVGLSLAEPPRVALGPVIGGGTLAGFSTEVRVAGPFRVEAWLGPRMHIGYKFNMNVMGGLGAAVEIGRARVRPAPFLRAGGAIPGPVLREALGAAGCDLRFYGPQLRDFASLSFGAGGLWKTDDGIEETNPLLYLRFGFHWGVGGDPREPAAPADPTLPPPPAAPADPAPPAEPTPPT